MSCSWPQTFTHSVRSLASFLTLQMPLFRRLFLTTLTPRSHRRCKPWREGLRKKEASCPVQTIPSWGAVGRGSGLGEQSPWLWGFRCRAYRGCLLCGLVLPTTVFRSGSGLQPFWRRSKWSSGSCATCSGLSLSDRVQNKSPSGRHP